MLQPDQTPTPTPPLANETPCAVCPHGDGAHLIGGGRCAEPGCLCRAYAEPRAQVAL
jgi:hypothetical protein